MVENSKIRRTNILQIYRIVEPRVFSIKLFFMVVDGWIEDRYHALREYLVKDIFYFEHRIW